MNEVKSIFWSRTFWATGVGPILLAVIDAVLQGLDWRQCVLAGFGALAIFLRTVTTKGIK